jgi:hypothetical protein
LHLKKIGCLLVIIGLGIPEIMLNIPMHIVIDYIETMKEQGVEVNFDNVIEDIPF